jgi:hypothetical protein
VPRIELFQLRFARPELFGHAGPKILDENVGGLDQFVEKLAILVLRRVEGDRALVAIVRLIVGTIQTALEGAERVAAAGALDLDHVGAEIGQIHRRRRAGDEGSHLDDPEALQDLHHRFPPYPVGLTPSYSIAWSAWFDMTKPIGRCDSS